MVTDRECQPFRPEEQASLDAFEPAYLSALDEIYHPSWLARKLRRRYLLQKCIQDIWPAGHPCRFIMVTGTNGKGSVCMALQGLLTRAGAVGAWTGPHVYDYAERIHVNGQPLSHQHLAEIYWTRLRPLQEQRVWEGQDLLSFAELGILLALHCFEIAECRWAVMEVGAGGRYTPLMALSHAALVLTNVGQDHPQTLGKHWWQRVLEKAGAAQPGQLLVSGVDEDQWPFVERIGLANGALPRSVHPIQGSWLKSQPHLSAYQRLNLALAYATVRWLEPQLAIPDDWPQVLSQQPARYQHHKARVLVDVAHNRDKLTALVGRIRHDYPTANIHLLVALSRERPVLETLEPLFKLNPKRWVVTSASYAGVDPSILASALQQSGQLVEVIADPKLAYSVVEAAMGDNDLLVMTGSAYMIDQALNPNLFLRELNASFGRRKGEP